MDVRQGKLLDKNEDDIVFQSPATVCNASKYQGLELDDSTFMSMYGSADSGPQCPFRMWYNEQFQSKWFEAINWIL